MNTLTDKLRHPLAIGETVKLDYPSYFAWYDELNGKWQQNKFNSSSLRLQFVDKFTVIAVYPDAQLHPDAAPSDAAHISYHSVDLIVPQQFLERVP